MDRIELAYDEFYTQIGKFNRISDLPEQIEFKMSPVAKALLAVVIIGAGIIAGISFILNDRREIGVFLFLTSLILYLYVYFTDIKPHDKHYTISKKGIQVDSQLFHWNKIDDLHFIARKTRRIHILSICFNYDGINKDFQLDSMTLSESEIRQILYMYQRWWIKNSDQS